MESLIKKAIDAIKANKQDYAIGLLEGVLEMTSSPTVGKIADERINMLRSNIISPERIPIVIKSNTEGEALDMAAAAKLAEVKRLAQQGLQ